MTTDPTESDEHIPLPVPLRRVLRIVKSADPAAVGRALPLDTGGTMVIGREVEGEGRIRSGASARHLVVHAPAGDASVERVPEGSPAWLNGQELLRREPLMDHDVLVFGRTIAVVDVEPARDLLPCRPGVDGGVAHEWIGRSLASQRVRAAIVTAARAPARILILAPTGAGKEVVAEAILRLSGARRQEKLDCGIILRERPTAELVGWKRGAFPGATTDYDGAFVRASGGILFLDEIGNLYPEGQQVLLRALESQEVVPLKGTTVKVDLRVIAATNADLAGGGEFRSDLFHRLAGFVLHLPPLSQRRADVLELFHHFMAARGRPRVDYSTRFAHALVLYGWPGNARELRNLAETLASTTTPEQRLELTDLPGAMQDLVGRERPHPPPTRPREEPTCEQLRQSLERNEGNIAAMMRELGIAFREQANRKLRRCNIDPDDYRRGKEGRAGDPSQPDDVEVPGP